MAKQNPDLEGYPAPAQSWPGSGNKGTPTKTGWGSEKISARRSGFIELILRQVVLALTNALSPGSAFGQLKAWGDDIGDGVRKIGTLVTGINFNQSPIEVWKDIIDVFVSPLEKFAELIGGFISPFHIPVLDPTKILNLPGLFDDVGDGFKAFFNVWFGRSDGTGKPAEVTYVIEKIKDAIINGYTVTTFTSDTVAWPVPLATDRLAMLIGGGQSGASSGANGGLHGSFVMAPIDLTAITAIDVQIGTAGNLSYIRAAATPPHTGTILAQSAVHGSDGGIAEGLAYKSTTSLPGSGGRGGVESTSTPAEPGQSTPAAVGGARGSSGIFGLGGSPGGSVSAGALIKCGGAGGGGGGYASAGFQTAGNGGAGGYPGGGGGGRGTAVGTGFPGSPGPGAPGVVWLAYK